MSLTIASEESHPAPPGRAKLRTCRECAAELGARAERCSACGCRAPYACDECGRALSAVTLGLAADRLHPYGSYSPEGAPLCYEHRLCRCEGCEALFPQGELTRRVVGLHEDTVMREGRTPRVEQVFALFCAACAASRSDVKAADLPTREGVVTAVVLLVGALMLVLLAVFFMPR